MRSRQAEPLSLLVDRQGRVVDASRPARTALGACVGLVCAEVVDVREGSFRSPCRAGCTSRLLQSATSLVTTGTVKGEPRMVTCAPLGDHVVVRIEP